MYVRRSRIAYWGIWDIATRTVNTHEYIHGKASSIRNMSTSQKWASATWNFKRCYTSNMTEKKLIGKAGAIAACTSTINMRALMQWKDYLPVEFWCQDNKSDLWGVCCSFLYLDLRWNGDVNKKVTSTTFYDWSRWIHIHSITEASKTAPSGIPISFQFKIILKFSFHCETKVSIK